jgi:hypothetical protein
MDAETAWTALYALHAFWTSRQPADIDAGRIAMNKSEYFAPMPGLTPAQRDAWFDLAACDVAVLQQRIRNEYSLTDPRFFDVLPFEERPLIAFGDLLFCASLPLLRRLPGSSLQHRLLDPKVFNRTETQRFLDTRGHLVELYTMEALARGFGDRLIPEARLKECAAGAKVCDGIIAYPTALILVECKTASVQLAARHARQYGPYRDTWKRVIGKAADQLESTIDLLRSGAFEPLGLRYEKGMELYPVVGVFEQPVHPLTYRAIRMQDLAGHPLSAQMDAGDVKPLQLLHITEVELWEMATERGRSVLDLLREKTSTPETTEIPFHHFIHLHGETFQHGHSQWHSQRFAAITNGARAYFRSLGLGVEEEEEELSLRG